MQIPERIITAPRELVHGELDRLYAAARHKRHANTAERDALRDERKKLLEVHFAGMIPLDLPGEEQERIARRPAYLDPRSTPWTSSTTKPRPISRTASPSLETATRST